MITAIIAILAGLLLLASFFGSVRGLERAVSALQPFETVIGVVAIVAGVLSITSLTGIVLILAGLILAIGALGAVPKIGPGLKRASGALEPFRILIGIITLVVGILGLFD